MKSPMNHEHTLNTTLLKKVSRSFYITIRILPKTIRTAISIAYMLGRTADTIADTTILDESKRLEKLCSLKRIIERKDPKEFNRLKLDEINHKNESSDKLMLVNSIPQQIHVLSSLPSFEQQEIISVTDKLIAGMKMDLRTFNSSNANHIKTFQDWNELENYMYFVAGSVGEFWTKITSKRTNAIDDSIMNEMVLLGINFGKSLQLTNIIRDVPTDLKTGRCYIPSSTLKFYQVQTSDLLSNSNIYQTQKLLKHIINHTLKYFCSAEIYITMIPKNHLRLRLSMIIPVMIGLQTLKLLISDNRWLDSRATAKISRLKTFKLIFQSLCYVCFNGAINFWIHKTIQNIKINCEELGEPSRDL